MMEKPYWLKEPFHTYSSYLKTLYNIPVYRVAVDAGFSCPNRGEDRKQAGCIYCDAGGARAPYLGDKTEIKQQVDGALRFLKKRYKAEAFILYFQAFSNTHAPIEKLKEIYDYALSLYPFSELIISTRPDCVSQPVVDLLAGYGKSGITTWVELGLQSASDFTLVRINRGHTAADFSTAYTLLKQHGIKVTAHTIFGLPGEDETEILNTIRFLAALAPDGIKIHNLHVVKGTALYTDFLKGEIAVPTYWQHLEYVIKALELLPPETVVMRITCDTPANLLVSPKNFLDKAAFYQEVRSTMLARQTWQGRYYVSKSSEL